MSCFNGKLQLQSPKVGAKFRGQEKTKANTQAKLELKAHVRLKA
jgi:hypothetical protein